MIAARRASSSIHCMNSRSSAWQSTPAPVARARAAGGLVEQHQPLARPELLGHVVGDEGDSVHRAVGVLQRRAVDGPRVDPPLAPGALEALQVYRLAALQ